MHTTIIFSKDRPLQLDLCLQSVAANWFEGTNVYVIYACTEDYKDAYSTLIKEHQDSQINFVEESNLPNDIMNILNDRRNEDSLLSFLTDDNIVFNKNLLDINMIHEVLQNKNITCFSCRLGKNIMYDIDGAIEFPRFEAEITRGHYFRWNHIATRSYWSYPLSLDGHIFRMEDAVDLFDKIYFGVRPLHTPNYIEDAMQEYRNEYGHEMACAVFSSVVNSPNNRVQNEYQNWHGIKYSYSPKQCLYIYNKGIRIDFDTLLIEKIYSPHQEIDLFKK